MPPVGFEPTISASERPQTYTLDRAATGTGYICAVVGVIMEKLDNMHGVTMKNTYTKYLNCYISGYGVSRRDTKDY